MYMNMCIYRLSSKLSSVKKGIKIIIFRNLVIWISKNLVARQFGMKIFNGHFLQDPFIPIRNDPSLTVTGRCREVKIYVRVNVNEQIVWTEV